MNPISCDTFVVLPGLTSHGGVIFGKNSDRPQGEVQELVYNPAQDFSTGSKVQCTYIEVDQVSHINAVILSKPAWMWGAEMGANEHGVVIGNEAVWTNVESSEDAVERLLGMDLLRLGLERASSAEEALDVIVNLLECYGQGGPCSDSIANFTYHNSFLIADPNDAWVLETAGRLWAAEKILEGFRNISNALSIGTKIDRCSANLKTEAQNLKLWDGKGEFNFSEVFEGTSQDLNSRYSCGRVLLQKLSCCKTFCVSDMFSILRNSESGICRSRDNEFPTTASQVSVLAAPGSGKPHCHWFTATPDPEKSVFKPFIFTQNARISKHTVSPTYQTDPAKVKPRFQSKVDRAHVLYSLHEATMNTCKPDVVTLLQEMERNCVAEVEAFIAEFVPGQSLTEVDDLLKDVVETEVKFYK